MIAHYAAIGVTLLALWFGLGVLVALAMHTGKVRWQRQQQRQIQARAAAERAWQDDALAVARNYSPQLAELDAQLADKVIGAITSKYRKER